MGGALQNLCFSSPLEDSPALRVSKRGEAPLCSTFLSPTSFPIDIEIPASSHFSRLK